MTELAKPETPLRQAALWSIRLNEAPGDDALRRAFENWLDQSPEHAMAWEDVGQVSTLLRKTQAPRRFSKPPKTSLAAAGAIAAALVMAIIVAPSASLKWSADHVTGFDEERTIVLPDQSTIRLSPSSAIAVDQSKGRREVTLLSGEAFFEVTPDPDRPFQVQTKDARVTVLGTGFNVRRGITGTDVAVRHGRVRVERNIGETVVLNSGDWTRATPHGVQSGHASPQVAGAWRQDRLIALDQSVSEMLSDARRRHRGMIILTDETLASRTVTGAYDMTDTASGLQVMVAPLGGKVHNITPWIIIVSK